MLRYNYPPSTEQGWCKGGIVKQANNIHRHVCDAVADYDSDDIEPMLSGLLAVQWEVETAIRMISARYNVDIDELHARLVKDNREFANSDVDVALWLEANLKEA